MDWLFCEGIIFNVLPDDEIVKKIADSDSKIQTLACLNYLEHEPEKENVALWGIIISLIVGVAGWSLEQYSTTIFDLLPWLKDIAGEEGSILLVVWLGVVILLATIWFTSRINQHIESIAAWASSWSIAIKEYKP